MIIVNKKAFSMGAFLAITFCGVLVIIFSPIYGAGRTGLQFSDDLFNKLSKGSSYFIPSLQQENAAFRGKPFAVTFEMEKTDQVETALGVLATAGAQVRANGKTLQVSGDLGELIDKVLADSDRMYHNDGKAVTAIYGLDERQVMESWWHILKQIDNKLKQAKRLEEAKMVYAVKNKAVETTYNFYTIPPEHIGDKVLLVTGLLTFYVVYTLWWGFAIFFLFNGMGLTMHKAKVRKEI